MEEERIVENNIPLDLTFYYEWLSIDELESVTLYPQFIKNEIKDIDNLKLIITKEN